MEQPKLNIRRLVDDLGGAAKVAAIVGVPRTAPYRWMRQGYIGSPALEKIKSEYPNIDLDFYFEGVK